VSGGVSANYDFNYVSGTLTVNQTGQPSFTITQGANVGKTYGDSAFTLTTSGGAGTGAITWSSNNACVTVNPTSGQVTINGAGTAVITAAKAGDANYNETTAQTTVTVSKKTLTVTADNNSRIYGEANPTLTFTYDGFVLGEDENVLTTKPTASTDATVASSVGTYTIAVSGGASDNYAFSYNPATLTVSQAAQSGFSVTQGASIGKTYGDSAFTLTTTGGAGTGAVTWSSDNACVSVNPTSGQVTINGIGTAVITATKAADTNYTQTTAQTTVTVAKKTLTVTADNKFMDMGKPPPALTFSYSGFVSGEDENVLTAEPTISTTATSTSSVGSYPIALADGVSDNYVFVYNNAILKVIDLNAEAAKITGFTVGTNTSDFSVTGTAGYFTNNSTLGFNPTVSGTLDANVIFSLVEVRTGANAGSTTVLAGSGINAENGVLSLNTQNTVNAADLSYVGVTFTVDLDGYASDPVTLGISNLFGATSTAGKLRTDKVRFNGNIIAVYPLVSVSLGDNSTGLAMSPGVSMPEKRQNITDIDDLFGWWINIPLRANEGGDIIINFSDLPTSSGKIMYSNTPIACAGTTCIFNMCQVNIS
jgi:hypothetical protein